MKKTGIGILLLILMSLSSFMSDIQPTKVCAVGAPNGGKVIQSETRITMGTTDSVESCIDPAHAYDFFGWQIIQSLGCGLVEYKVNASGSPDDFAQSLATSWNVSDDGLAWAFNLRQGVKYDDGTEFNATHVKYTFDRGIGIADPDGAWLGIAYNDIIKNVTVVDKYTIRFDLNLPFAPFLSLIACPVAFIVDPAYAPMDQVVTYHEGNPRASNPMGLGPYILKKWTRVAGRDIEMELDANPNYWNASAGLPRTKNILIKMYSDATQLALAITSKQVDVAFRQLAISDIIVMKDDASLKVWEGSGEFIQYLVLQEKYFPFNVRAIRKAVGAAVNRTALVQTVFLGQAQNLYSMIPIGMFGHTDAFLNLGNPNYTLTRELLAPLGYNESNKLAFTLSYETSGHYPQSQQQAEVLRASIEASGVITVKLQGLDWGAMRFARRDETMEAFIMGWLPDYIDPDDYVYPFVHSAGASWLHYHYSNASVDRLIEAGRERLTAAERAAVYSQIQSLVAEDCPIVPLYQSLTQAVSVRGIEGIYLDMNQLLRLWYIVRESGTIYIRSDGSIDPPTAPMQRNGDVYTLTNNIATDANGIVIERNNMTLDGAGYLIQGMGNGPSAGIYATGRTNVTISRTEITACYYGIYLNASSGSGVNGNNIKENKIGIELSSSSFNDIHDNTIERNSLEGIELFYYSNSNNIFGNNLTANGGYGITVLSQSSGNVINENVFSGDGMYISYSQGNFVEGNIVNRKPLVYLEGVSNRTIDDAGQVILVNCENILVENLNLSNTAVGVELLGTRNSKIVNNIIANNPSGVYLEDASNNVVSENNVTANKWSGIRVYMSSNNNISENIVTGNGQFLNGDGISMYFSKGNILGGNDITANKWHGLEIYESSENTVSGNNLTANGDFGIYIYRSSSNRIDGNCITANPVGMYFNDECMHNSIYHNNFDQPHQVEFQWFGQSNFWDNGCEGNYWSNYNGTDTDNDGVGDTLLSWEDVDSCPLMNVYWSPCDINHDLKVNMRDVGISSKAFGTRPGDTLWNPHADIIGPEQLVADGKVDMRDISLIAKHFAENYT